MELRATSEESAAQESAPVAHASATARESLALEGESVRTLIEAARRELRPQRRRLWLAGGLAALGMACLVGFCMHLVAILPWVIRGDFVKPRRDPIPPLSVLWALLPVPTLLVLFFDYQMWRRRPAVRRLADVGHPRLLAPLLEALRYPCSPGERRILMRAVTPLLESAALGTPEALTEAQRRPLRRVLVSPTDRFTVLLRGMDADFLCAVVRALAAVGDQRETDVISDWANRRPRNDQERQVQQTAVEVLPALLERVARESAPDILLRPSEPDLAPTLLRPAVGHLTNDHAQLLRATSTDSQGDSPGD